MLMASSRLIFAASILQDRDGRGRGLKQLVGDFVDHDGRKGNALLQHTRPRMAKIASGVRRPPSAGRGGGLPVRPFSKPDRSQRNKDAVNMMFISLSILGQRKRKPPTALRDRPRLFSRGRDSDLDIVVGNVRFNACADDHRFGFPRGLGSNDRDLVLIGLKFVGSSASPPISRPSPVRGTNPAVDDEFRPFLDRRGAHGGHLGGRRAKVRTARGRSNRGAPPRPADQFVLSRSDESVEIAMLLTARDRR